MASRGALRASDADREQVAERLRRATAEGRLLAEELEERLGVAFSARTYGELDVLTADLPGDRMTPRRRRATAPWLPPVVAVALAIPIALAILAIVALVLVGLLATWAIWMLAAWWFFGLRRTTFARRVRGGPVGPRGARRTQARSGFWL